MRLRGKFVILFAILFFTSVCHADYRRVIAKKNAVTASQCGSYCSNGDYYTVYFDDTLANLGFSDDDNINGVSVSNQTFDGKTVLSQDTNTAASGNRADVSIDTGTFPTSLKCTIEYYAQDIGTNANNDCIIFILVKNNGNDVALRSCSDGFYVYDGASWVDEGTGNQVCSGSAEGCWVDISLDIDFSGGTMEIYVDGSLAATGTDITYNLLGGDGTLKVRLLGVTTNNQTSYTNSIVCGSAWQ